MVKTTNISTLDANRRTILIAGGGIAGLYAARELAARDDISKIVLLEASPARWGGRIETEQLDGFTAEFGPMRFEPALQPLFDALAAFAPTGGELARVHVCGEAYSDYSGFIEGALRTVRRALATIPDLNESNQKVVSP